MNERTKNRMLRHMRQGQRIGFFCALGTALSTAPGISGAALQAQGRVATADAAGADVPGSQALLARRVTVNATHISRRHAIYLLAKGAKVVIQYRVPLIDAFRDSVDLHVTNMPLGIALEQVLTGTNLRVVPDGTTQLTIVASGFTRDSVVNGGTVSGRVVDSSSGKGMAGAIIAVQGTKLSATSSDSGRFTLHGVPLGDRVLTVRLFGHRLVAKEVTVTEHDPAVVRVTMVSVPNVLSGVVTTATGVQRKLEVGNDITTLNVDSLQRVAPITSVTDLLESRVPGVTVQRTSGVPGAPARIRLRGVGSISRNNDPIVIVDGVRVYAQQSDPRNTDTLGRTRIGTYATPSPLDQIDPNTIETIEVLKGPSASAMYGSDAGNGVIVITTKHGRAGPTHLAMTLDQGLSFQPGDYPVGTYRFGHRYSGVTQLCPLAVLGCTVDSVVTFQALNDPKFAVTTGHGNTQRLSSTVSGGVSGLAYSLSGSVARYTGQFKLPDIEAERFTAFHGFAPPEWMKHPDHYTTANGTSALDLPISAGQGRSGTVSLTSSLFKSDQQQSSLQTAIRALEGIYVDTTQLGAQPLISEFYERVNNGSVNFTNALSVRWPVATWLPLTITGGMNLMNTTAQTLTPRDYKMDADSVGYFGLDRGNAVTYTLDANTNIQSRWATTALGFNFVNASINDLASKWRGLAVGVNSPSSFTGLAAEEDSVWSTETSTGNSTYGWFLAPTLNVHSRFFVTPGLRLDGGSASGGHVSTSVGGQSIRGLSGFPKMDFSWLAVDPSDVGSKRGVRSVVSLLRFRGAFGTAGRQPDPADQLRLFAQSQVPQVGSQPGSNILQVQTLGNTRLRPERSREVETGVDAELWQGRIVLGVTSARKTTSDAIIPLPIAPSVSGQRQTTIQSNIGAIRNTDLELSAQALVFQRPSMQWDVSAVLTRSSNVVVRLNPGPTPVPNANGSDVASRIVPGYPINGSWAYPILGYADNNSDGIIEAEEVLIGDSLRYVGQPQPDYQLTFNTNAAVLNGRLSVHTTLAYQHGITQFNQVGGTAGNACGAYWCALSGVQLFGNDPTASLGQQAAFAALVSDNPIYANPTTVYGLVQIVNTLRWQDLSLNYVAPMSFARLFRARQLTIALQGSNLALRTNYHGKDPNVNGFSSGEGIIDSGQLPQPRTFDLKVIVGN